VPKGLEGVCLPSTWTAEDHRGLMTVSIYRMHVKGATDAPVADLVKNGAIKLERIKTVEMPRKPELLGW
jgi:branched-chain amino acid transport system substrate-binding protein